MKTALQSLGNFIVIVCLTGIVCGPRDALAAPPAWWRNPNVLKVSNLNFEAYGPIDADKAAATVGQVMHMAKHAKLAMDSVYASVTAARETGAGAEIQANLTRHNNSIATEGALANHRVILNGQLKSIAAPYWKRLAVLGVWPKLSVDLGVFIPNEAYDAAPDFPFPWTQSFSDDADYAVATLGQVKAAFAFHLETPDENNSGIYDGWEYANFRLYQDPFAYSTSSEDPDLDGFPTLAEYVAGSNPASWDTDMDGLSDFVETGENGMTSRLNPDSDGDGLPDGWEKINYCNSLDSGDATADCDGDGLTNLEEFNYSTEPGLADTDSDGLTDSQEVARGEDPLVAFDDNYDHDGDRLSTKFELRWKVDVAISPNSTAKTQVRLQPLTALDDDRDGIPDDWELVWGYISPSHPPDSALPDAPGDHIDSDMDGLSDRQEFAHRTWPKDWSESLLGQNVGTDFAELSAALLDVKLGFAAVAVLDGEIVSNDSDMDGELDGAEVRTGRNPLVPDAPPETPGGPVLDPPAHVAYLPWHGLYGSNLAYAAKVGDFQIRELLYSDAPPFFRYDPAREGEGAVSPKYELPSQRPAFTITRFTDNFPGGKSQASSIWDGGPVGSPSFSAKNSLNDPTVVERELSWSMINAPDSEISRHPKLLVADHIVTRGSGDVAYRFDMRRSMTGNETASIYHNGFGQWRRLLPGSGNYSFKFDAIPFYIKSLNNREVSYTGADGLTYREWTGISDKPSSSPKLEWALFFENGPALSETVNIFFSGVQLLKFEKNNDPRVRGVFLGQAKSGNLLESNTIYVAEADSRMFRTGTVYMTANYTTVYQRVFINNEDDQDLRIGPNNAPIIRSRTMRLVRQAPSRSDSDADPVADPRYTLDVSEDSGAEHRRVGINGLPVADQSPAESSSFDELAFGTSVDALTHHLRHAASDIRVPIASSALELAVTRNLSEEIFTNRGVGPKPFANDDSGMIGKPFGVCWDRSTTIPKRRVPIPRR
jgi:hypothetical protein